MEGHESEKEMELEMKEIDRRYKFASRVKVKRPTDEKKTKY